MRVGFIGLGAMGRPMAERLLEAGHELQVYDVAEEPVRRLAARGARAAGCPGEAAAGCPVVVVIPFDYPQVEACVLGEGGVLSAAGPGTALLLMATVAPEEARRLAAAASGRGVRVVDAPVTGGVRGAETGTLTAIVGGAAEDVEACRPVLDPLCGTVAHVGPLGAGLTVKALNQMLYAVHLAAACEAAVLARKAGVDLNQALRVLSTGAADSWVLRNRGPVLADGTYRTGGRTAIMRKDLGIALALAKGLDQPLPVTAAAAQLYEWSALLGYADRDDAHLALALLGEHGR